MVFLIVSVALLTLVADAQNALSGAFGATAAAVPAVSTEPEHYQLLRLSGDLMQQARFAEAKSAIVAAAQMTSGSAECLAYGEHLRWRMGLQGVSPEELHHWLGWRSVAQTVEPDWAEVPSSLPAGSAQQHTQTRDSRSQNGAPSAALSGFTWVLCGVVASLLSVAGVLWVLLGKHHVPAISADASNNEPEPGPVPQQPTSTAAASSLAYPAADPPLFLSDDSSDGEKDSAAADANEDEFELDVSSSSMSETAQPPADSSDPATPPRSPLPPRRMQQAAIPEIGEEQVEVDDADGDENGAAAAIELASGSLGEMTQDEIARQWDRQTSTLEDNGEEHQASEREEAAETIEGRGSAEEVHDAAVDEREGIDTSEVLQDRSSSWEQEDGPDVNGVAAADESPAAVDDDDADDEWEDVRDKSGDEEDDEDEQNDEEKALHEEEALCSSGGEEEGEAAQEKAAEEKAAEEAAATKAAEEKVLQAELAAMKMSELKRRARAEGIGQDELDLFDDTADPRQAVTEALLARRPSSGQDNATGIAQKTEQRNLAVVEEGEDEVADDAAAEAEEEEIEDEAAEDEEYDDDGMAPLEDGEYDDDEADGEAEEPWEDNDQWEGDEELEQMNDQSAQEVVPVSGVTQWQDNEEWEDNEQWEGEEHEKDQWEEEDEEDHDQRKAGEDEYDEEDHVGVEEQEHDEQQQRIEVEQPAPKKPAPKKLAPKKSLSAKVEPTSGEVVLYDEEDDEDWGWGQQVGLSAEEEQALAVERQRVAEAVAAEWTPEGRWNQATSGGERPRHMEKPPPVAKSKGRGRGSSASTLPSAGAGYAASSASRPPRPVSRQVGAADAEGADEAAGPHAGDSVSGAKPPGAKPGYIYFGRAPQTQQGQGKRTLYPDKSSKDGTTTASGSSGKSKGSAKKDQDEGFVLARPVRFRPDGCFARMQGSGPEVWLGVEHMEPRTEANSAALRDFVTAAGGRLYLREFKEGEVTMLSRKNLEKRSQDLEARRRVIENGIIALRENYDTKKWLSGRVSALQANGVYVGVVEGKDAFCPVAEIPDQFLVQDDARADEAGGEGTSKPPKFLVGQVVEVRVVRHSWQTDSFVASMLSYEESVNRRRVAKGEKPLPPAGARSVAPAVAPVVKKSAPKLEMEDAPLEKLKVVPKDLERLAAKGYSVLSDAAARELDDYLKTQNLEKLAKKVGTKGAAAAAAKAAESLKNKNEIQYIVNFQRGMNPKVIGNITLPTKATEKEVKAAAIELARSEGSLPAGTDHKGVTILKTVVTVKG